MAFKIKVFDEDGEEYIDSASYETSEEAEAMIDAHFESGDLGCVGEKDIMAEEVIEVDD